jgi:hypothetical protein
MTEFPKEALKRVFGRISWLTAKPGFGQNSGYTGILRVLPVGRPHFPKEPLKPSRAALVRSRNVSPHFPKEPLKPRF